MWSKLNPSSRKLFYWVKAHIVHVYYEYVCFIFASSCKRGISYRRCVRQSVCVCDCACLSHAAIKSEKMSLNPPEPTISENHISKNIARDVAATIFSGRAFHMLTTRCQKVLAMKADELSTCYRRLDWFKKFLTINVYYPMQHFITKSKVGSNTTTLKTMLI